LRHPRWSIAMRQASSLRTTDYGFMPFRVLRTWMVPCPTISASVDIYPFRGSMAGAVPASPGDRGDDRDALGGTWRLASRHGARRRDGTQARPCASCGQSKTSASSPPSSTAPTCAASSTHHYSDAIALTSRSLTAASRGRGVIPRRTRRLRLVAIRCAGPRALLAQRPQSAAERHIAHPTPLWIFTILDLLCGCVTIKMRRDFWPRAQFYITRSGRGGEWPVARSA
jgi:hypothetical protein